MQTVGDLLIFNRVIGPMGAPPCPDTPMYTSQRKLLQDALTITVTFLILQFHFIQLSSFSPYYTCFFVVVVVVFYNCITVMSKYTFTLYAMDWVYSGRVFSCFSQCTTSMALLSYMTHMTPWNFLPSKFLEGHTLSIVHLVAAFVTNKPGSQIAMQPCPAWLHSVSELLLADGEWWKVNKGAAFW